MSRDYWDIREQARPFLENFCDRSLDRWTLQTLERDIMERDRQLWNISDFQAVCLTSVGETWVAIDACAGVRRREWQEELEETIRSWAKRLGKRRIIAKVRPGWAPFGRQCGYKEKHREMVLEL